MQRGCLGALQTFFDVEDGEVENLAPETDANAGAYQFGGHQPQQPGGFNFAAASMAQ